MYDISRSCSHHVPPPLCLCLITSVGVLLLHPPLPFVFLPTKTLDCHPKYSPIKLFIRAGMVDWLPLPAALKPWGEQGGTKDIVRAEAGSYSCHSEGTICIDSSVGFFCGRRQRPIEYLPPVAGGGGPHNKSPWWGSSSGLLRGFFMVSRKSEPWQLLDCYKLEIGLF